ncbi:MAG: RNA methyltransferase [Methanocalculus sp. MSAO_Arc2]|uniref:RNA methyltransferase n=1 Tax=Methanocalculus sp. MSAO_Arc2 TaxID=2293855 RepID=UPI000FF56C8E|nr:MAG: RNA methyltransferase [Methanocalculus sp. MSAO_Arc2]
MPEVDIVLVEPLYEGNVGFAARAMKNFGFKNLVLVNCCSLGDEAIARASHARDILQSALHLTLEEVFARSALSVATTGTTGKSVTNPMRMPYYSPAELREIISPIDGRVSILFGRENWGLNNEEISRTDLICTIPASDEYPIINISHAVAIICYELAGLPRGEYLLASRLEMDCLFAHISSFLDRISHPPEKRAVTLLLIRRVLGRTHLTAREASTLHGLMRRTEWHLDNPEGSDKSDQVPHNGNDPC